MLSDYYWTLIRETDQNNYKRRSSTVLHFEPDRENRTADS